MTRQELIDALQRTGEPNAEVVLRDTDSDFLTLGDVTTAYSGEIILDCDEITYDVVETEDVSD
jgi:hypothetical protein